MSPSPRRALFRLLVLALGAGTAAVAPLAAVPAGAADPAPTTATFQATPSTLGAVADNTCRTVEIPVSGTGDKVTAVSLSLTMTHTWVGDLRVQLTAPGAGAPSSPVFGRPGLSLVPYGDDSNLSGTYQFADSAVSTIGVAAAAALNDGDVVAPGTYHPTTFETPVNPALPVSFASAFGTATATGTWTVQLCDLANPDPGTVSAAALTLTTSADTTAPTTSIDSGPIENARVKTAPSYGFSSPDDDVARFECRTDADAYDVCTSPYSPVLTGDDDGEHTVSIRAVDDSGNTGAPATRSFTLDTLGPVVGLTSGPASGTRVQTAPSYGFSSSDADVASFQCRTDALTFEACTSPYEPQLTGDADGQHTVFVRAIDDLGNIGATLTVTFVLDTLGPEVSITGGPDDGAAVTDQPSYTFSTAAADLDGFECQVDDGAFDPCTSPTSTDVDPGAHSFGVRATDDLGNIGPTTTRTFTLRDVACEDATADLATARAALAKAKKQLKKAKRSGNPHRIKKAKAKVKRAKQAVRAAQADVAQEC